MPTVPMQHQLAALAAARGRQEFALLMEQGTGKTKVIIEFAAELFLARRIDRVLIVAPNGVHRDWTEGSETQASYMATHCPDSVPFCSAAYRSGAGVKRSRQYAELAAPSAALGPLRVLSVNIEALKTKTCYDLALKFLRNGPALMALDESDDIKTPGNRRTRCAIELGKKAAYRLISTGTVISQGPLDFYAQFQFLRPGLLGAPNYASFKARYAEWEEKRSVDGHGREFSYAVVKRYKNLEELKARVAAHSFQILKKDCLDLPEKAFVVRTVDLSSETEQAYRRVRDRILAELPFGTMITAHPLTKLTRLAQIVGGFAATEEQDGVVALPGPNAKLQALLADIQRLHPDSQFIVWARFVPELNMIARELQSLGIRCARYWGEIDQKARKEEADEFKSGVRRAMVAQQQAGGRGHTWVQGTFVFYYSNNFSYRDRVQSEDRAHRIGQTERVTYTDYIARSTIDEKIFRALSAKEDVANYFKTIQDILQ